MLLSRQPQGCRRCPSRMGFKQTRNDTIAISGPLLLAKANLLAKDLGHDDFVATIGCQPDQTFNQFCMKKISGKEKSVSKDVEAWLYSTLPDLLKTYKPEDIYNETKQVFSTNYS